MKKVIPSSHYIIEQNIIPEFIYFPTEDVDGIKYKPLKREGEYVYKNTPLLRSSSLRQIYSPISGYVRNICLKTIDNGKKVNCLVIENDFKEKYLQDKSFDYFKEDISFKDLIDIMNIYGLNIPSINALCNSLSFQKDSSSIKYFLVSALDPKYYVTTNLSIFYNYVEDLLFTIDFIREKMHIPEAIIALRDSEKKLFQILNKQLGTYPRMTLQKVEDIPGIEQERILINYLFDVKYDKYPFEKQIVTLDISSLYDIFKILKYRKPLTDKIITISGPGIKYSKNVKVKIGMLASEVIKQIGGYQKIKNPLFIAGSLLNGKSLPTDDVIITKDTNSLLVINHNFSHSFPCINCGKCIAICPVSLLPVLIMKNKDGQKKLRYLNPQKCTKCGLCSYICPSKIEVCEAVQVAKEKVSANAKF